MVLNGEIMSIMQTFDGTKETCENVTSIRQQVDRRSKNLKTLADSNVN